MVRCDMCGMDVPAGPNGKCFLGHALPGGVPVAVDPAPVVVDPAPAPVPMPEPPAPEPVVVAAEASPIAVATVTPAAPFPAVPAAAADAPAFASSVPSELIAAAVAEVERPVADAPAESSGFTAPRPLGQAAMPSTQPAPPAAPTPTPSPPLSAPPPVAPPQAVAPPHALAPPQAVAPPHALAPPQAVAPPLAQPVALPLQVQGTAALAPQPQPMAPPAPVGDLFVVSPEQKRRAPNKALMLVLILALLGGGAFAAKTFVFGGDADVAATGPGGAPAGSVREAGSLARAYVGGEVHRYVMNANITTSFRTGTDPAKSFNASMKMTFTERVVNRAEDGSATIRYSFDGATMSVEGQQSSIPIPPGLAFEARIGPDGKVHSVEQVGGGELPMDSSWHEMLAPVLPPGARPGDRWARVDKPSIPDVGDIEVKTVFHYVKDEGTNAILDFSAEAPFSLSINAEDFGELATGGASLDMRGRMLGKGRQTVDKKTGRTVAAAMDMTMTFAAFENGVEAGRMAMKMKMTLESASGVSPSTA